MNINYTAKRNLAPGHVVSTAYDLETDAHQIDPIRKVGKTTTTSLGGNPETNVSYIDRHYNITTDYIEAANLPLWDEFVDSTEASELITIDLYGTTAAPENPVSARVVGTPTLKRVSGMVYQLSFVVAIV